MEGVTAKAEAETLYIQSIRNLQRTILKLDKNNTKLNNRITVVATVFAFIQAISAVPLILGYGIQGIIIFLIAIVILIMVIIHILK